MNTTLQSAMQAAFVEDNNISWTELGGGMKRKIMSYNDDIMLVKVAFETGAIGALHQHIHTQISYVVKGVFEITIGDKKQILHAGDVFFAEPNIWHGATCIEEGELLDMFSPKREDFLQ